MAPLRRGIHRPLEEEADRLLRESLRGVTKHSDKADILTARKYGIRRRRELYPTSGVADASVRLGNFHRALNTTRPELNSREGVARARSGSGTLADFVIRDHLD